MRKPIAILFVLGALLIVQTLSAEESSNSVTLGLGYGASHGGFGGFAQYNTTMGISFHVGVGYFPSSLFLTEYEWVKGRLLFSGGLKYYPPLDVGPLNIYLDLQFGGLGVLAMESYEWNWDTGFTYERNQKTAWGPSILCGSEIKIGSFGFNGAIGISYNITKVDWWDKNIVPTLDVSILVYF